VAEADPPEPDTATAIPAAVRIAMTIAVILIFMVVSLTLHVRALQGYAKPLTAAGSSPGNGT